MIKAVIFDMDGTLVDSEEFVTVVEIETFKSFGIPATPELIKEFTGVRFREEIREISDRYKISLSENEVIAVHYKTLGEYYKNKIPLIPGVIEILTKLKEKYLLGLATSGEKDLATIPLTTHDLLNFFSATTFGEDVKFGKPNPEIFLLTAVKLGVKPEEAIVIEDAITGVEAAKQANMKVIAKRGSHNKSWDFSKADYIINDLTEIPKILEEM